MVAWVLYYYNPSSAAAGIFLVLFGLGALLHFYQLVRTRTWFMIPFLIGAILETVGYVGRLLSSFQSPNWTTGPYIIQSALLLIAPAFFAASIYMELGRIVRVLEAEKLAVVPVRWLTAIFVTGDVLSFLMQASGAGLMVQNTSNPDMGEHIIVGGLFVQIIFFGFFFITTMFFQLRIGRSPTSASIDLSSIWKKHLFTLHACSILILVRSVVRVVEYLQGYTGFIAVHEVFLYIFDAVLMLAVVICMNFTHPSEINCLLGRSDWMIRGVKAHKSVPRSGELPM
ncbi:hypothetical protein ASPZODRAFT_136359 [Penicilliopsis zonata CBS 506.65]|uniref:RTA1 like protein n=1 Tax=Penicilliopsis zonata CBS 506.65 TaxID=1073090 RepID=A0A1L9S8J3_9EURO|nr:hypothetical protein ASPZODRAFT_136359 [Penicilliopsis zonata CBS 506.65]OJJ43481.1 hypothetical protein ASPZODRAFT_136359 [Penicilliopsis zonata CBS 506.65]